MKGNNNLLDAILKVNGEWIGYVVKRRRNFNDCPCENSGRRS